MTTNERAALLNAIAPKKAVSLQKALDRIEDALNIISTGLEEKALLNVIYKEAKAVLDNAVYDARRERKYSLVSRGSEKCTNHSVEVVCESACITSVREAIAVSKRLDKSKLSDEFVDDARAFISAVLPLAKDMEAVKAFIVKGRRPASPEVVAARQAAAANVKSMPRGTCGCCLHNQAVLPSVGTMHVHSYQVREGSGFLNRCCIGSQFRPLEVSDEGPRYMVSSLTNELKRLGELLSMLPFAKTLEIPNNIKVLPDGSPAPLMRTIALGESGFENTRCHQIRCADGKRREAERNLTVFQKIVAEWKPAAK